MGSIRGLRSLMVVPALGIGLACTAILNPRDDVERCGASTDCEGTGDNRYVVECRFEEGIDSTEVDGVCVAEFAQPSCNPESYTSNPEHPLVLLPQMLGTTRHTCAMDQQGLQGCPPRLDGTCNDGLSVRNGICDAPNGDAVNLAGSEFGDQDIRDQFCRYFFCDDEFVCDRDSGDICVRCDPDAEFGNGGCGTVYVAGAPSCVYTDVDDTCDAPDSNADEPAFGC